MTLLPYLRAGVAVLLLGFLGACATPARIDGMTAGYQVTAAASDSALRTRVSIEQVTGGKGTNPLWTSQVDNTRFRAALEQSLASSGLLADGRMDSFLLTADLQSLKQPMFGASMTVTASIRYRLVDRVSDAAVYDRTISIPYTAKFSDSFIGTERLKLANEGAIRLNIEALIQDLVVLTP